VGETKNAYRILVGENPAKTSTWEVLMKREDNIKTVRKQKCFRDWWWMHLVLAVLTLRVFITQWEL